MKKSWFDQDTIEELKTNVTLPEVVLPTPVLVNKNSLVQGGSSKELIMHCLMYATSLYSELSEFRAHTTNDSHKVAFYSGALTQI